jgi:hypothetical protein
MSFRHWPRDIQTKNELQSVECSIGIYGELRGFQDNAARCTHLVLVTMEAWALDGRAPDFRYVHGCGCYAVIVFDDFRHVTLGAT